jgi:hypothetical protein
MEDYCLMCELGAPEYRATFRDATQAPKWATPDGYEWVRDICHDCRGEMERQADKGEIWQLSFQRKFSHSKFHYAPKVKG